MKTYRIYHANGKPENIEGSSETHTKTKIGLTVKIGKRTIKDAIALMEVLDEIKLPVQIKPSVDDDE